MMRIKRLFKACLPLIIMVAILCPLNAQVAVERSKDKVIISGTQYYIHQVRKGETAYSISKAYNITVEELTKENPPAVYGINEGQTLRIPVREVSEKAPEQSGQPKLKHDDAKFIYHKLQPGETIYSLSKAFGVSENEIISSNPGIEISRLTVGSEIAVPRKDFMTDRQEFAVQESNYLFHKVVKGESLSSIAGQYGLSVRELRKENRNIRFPQVGDYIRVPVTKVAETLPVSATPGKDSVKAVTEQPVIEFARPAGRTPVRNLEGSYDVAVLLPFFLKENAKRNDLDSSVVKGRKIFKVIKRSDEWIYPRSLGFVEMYQGILMACDTLRSLGLDINIHAFDIKSDTIELTRLMRNGLLDNMDLIIGPVNSSNLAKLAAYTNKLGIPVVSPVSLFNNSVLTNNPNLFMANASLNVAQNTIAKKVSEYYDKNFVFIHTDTAGVDPDVKNFKEKIIQELSNRIPYEEIKFKEFIFYSRSAFNNDSINRLGHALSSTTDNIVIIASDEAPVISETLQDLQGLSKKYALKVFGYPDMRGIENLDPRYFFDLDILMYSPFWIDYNSRDVKLFNTDFRNKFLTEPDEMSYAWVGYDIIYYFLSGLAIHGNDFIAHPEMHNPKLLSTEFDFRRNSLNDGFENQKLYPVRYTKEFEVKLSPEDTPGQ
jgi:LysM repeat protein/ABC-type branched-subunit amino acid transport system substrate-binding protein